MLSEKSQSKKIIYYMIPFIKHFRKDKVIDMKFRFIFARS